MAVLLILTMVGLQRALRQDRKVAGVPSRRKLRRVGDSGEDR